MEALSGVKSVLVKTFLYKKSNFKIGFFEIPFLILNIAFAVPMLVNTLLMIYRIAVEYKGSLKVISGSFYLSLGTTSAVCIYSSYAANYEKIIELVEIIQNVVNQRKNIFLKTSFITANDSKIKTNSLNYRCSKFIRIKENLLHMWSFKQQVCP